MANAIQLAPHLWALEGARVRCFLAVGDERALLIDTGYGDMKLPAQVSAITDKPLLVLNTHTDRDHIGENASFPEILIHPAEYDRYYSRSAPAHPPKPIWDGQELDLGGVRYQVLLTPGHTPGSVCLYDEANKALICGDVIQNVPIFMFGPGRNMQAYCSSLERLLALEPSLQVLYSSHGQVALPPSYIGRLLTAARAFLSGLLPEESAPEGFPCKLYPGDGCGFYADPIE